MSIYLSTVKATAVYLGGTAATAVYLGSTKVWPDAPPPPVETIFNMTGANAQQVYTIPAGYTKFDVVAIGAGEGGTNGSVAGNGQGGQAGNWVGKTLVKGVDFPAGTTSFTVVVGDAVTGNTNGTDGKPSTVSGAGLTTITATGGSGGMGLVKPAGEAAGNFTWAGRTYVGGAEQGNLNTAGNLPGGGGAGGGWASNGGAGAHGRVWIYAYN